MRHKFLVLPVKKLLKSVQIYGSCRKIKTGVPFFGTPGICVCELASLLNRGPMCRNTPNDRGPKVTSEDQSRSSLADVRYVMVPAHCMPTAPVLALPVCVCVYNALIASKSVQSIIDNSALNF